MKAVFLTAWLIGLAGLLVSPCAFAGGSYEGKRVFFINSYHPGYEWSDGEEKGARGVLEPLGVAFKAFSLDSKRVQDPEKLGQASLEALSEIRTFKPDVIIAADDNAQTYVVAPHLKNGPIPVVFCGVNWDASPYGYPTPNVTGMIEVDPVETLVNHLLRFAKGKRVGLVTDDTESERKSVAFYDSLFFHGGLKKYFVNNFNEFKEAVVDAQHEVDALIILNNASIKDWNPAQAEAFLVRTLRVPSGTLNEWMAPYVAFSVGKSPEEQGEWAARAALAIMDGAGPGSIPVARNEKSRLVVNLKMASAAGIVIPVSLLRAAERVIGAESVRDEGTSPAPAQSAGKTKP